MLILADSGILLRLLERTDPQHQDVRQAVQILISPTELLSAQTTP
jgi:hypothetical protein